MQVFEGFERVKGIARPVVSIGSYDGLHCGHRGILARLKEEAATRGGESTIITFTPHPRQVLYPDRQTRLLNTWPEKLELLKEIGIDNVVIITFTPEFSRMPAEIFIRDCLVGCLHIDTLIAGYNHHWGCNQEGNTDKLQTWGDKFGFRIEEVPKQLIGRSKVSSTVIRNLLDEGRLCESVRYLGAPYPVSGVFTEGVMRGINPDKLLPPSGTYTVKCKEIDKSFPAVIAIEHDRTITFRKPHPAPDGVPVTLKFT